MKPTKILAFLLFANLAFAQQITTGQIKPVKTEGLHKILLPPEIRSFSKEDLRDFRIYDRKKNEVPYFVVEGNSHVVLTDFVEYPIVAKNSIPKKNTSYIIEVGPGKKLNSLSLVLNNSDAAKKYDLSGSNDQSVWFGISNKATLDGLSSDKNTTVTRKIHFPLSAYRYLKIVFNDVQTLPVNLIRTGNSQEEIRENSLLEIVPQTLTTEQLKEEKITVIHVAFEHPQIINRIHFDVISPKYFRRSVSVHENTTRKVRRKNITYNDYICGFELSSQKKTSFEMPQFFGKNLEIEIINQDNQPLEIEKITFGQLPTHIVADLKANEKYTIATGSPKLYPPQYDIADFSGKDLGILPLASISDIRHNDVPVGSIANQSLWQQSWFMWLCICLGAIAILYFTWSLVRDMKK